jgi:hypothetical protein
MGKDEQVIGSEDSEGRKAEPSGVEGGNSTGPGQSETHPHEEAATETVNPSAPGETGTTPGTNGK